MVFVREHPSGNGWWLGVTPCMETPVGLENHLKWDVHLNTFFVADCSHPLPHCQTHALKYLLGWSFLPWFGNIWNLIFLHIFIGCCLVVWLPCFTFFPSRNFHHPNSNRFSAAWRPQEILRWFAQVYGASDAPCLLYWATRNYWKMGEFPCKWW